MNIKSVLKDYNKEFILAICFVISPLLTLPFAAFLFLHAKNPVSRVIYAVMMSCTMAFVAFHTIPLESDDLYRHLWSISVLREIPFADIFAASYQGVYLNTLIMYLVSQTGVYGLYPALFVGLGYFLIWRNMSRLDIHKRRFPEAALIMLFVFFAVNCRDFICL